MSLFLLRRGASQPARRIREVLKAARHISQCPKLYPVEAIHPISGLDFRRKNVGQFAIIYSWLEPNRALPNGMVSVRAIRHGAEEDVLFRVEESRVATSEFGPLRTHDHSSFSEPPET